MIPHRPVLVGMNSPQSSDPADALRVWNHTCTGGRILDMLQSATRRHSRGYAITAKDYERVFYRRNLVDAREWDPALARERGPKVIESMRNDSVVVLCGRDVNKALRLPRLDWLEWGHYQWLPTLGFRYFVIPHPSGLTRLYNDWEFRDRVGDRLLELYEEYEALRRSREDG